MQTVIFSLQEIYTILKDYNYDWKDKKSEINQNFVAFV